MIWSAYSSFDNGTGVILHSHEQASLTAGTITNDDELASDLSHVFSVFEGRKKKRL